MFRRQVQESQRQADLIVVVALALQGVVALIQNCGDDLLAGGLAYAAGDAHDPNVVLAPPEGRRLLKSRQAVRHDEAYRDTGLPHARINCQLASCQHNASNVRHPFGNKRDGSLLGGFTDEIMPIASLSRQGDEEGARGSEPRVDHCAADFEIWHSAGGQSPCGHRQPLDHVFQPQHSGSRCHGPHGRSARRISSGGICI